MVPRMYSAQNNDSKRKRDHKKEELLLDLKFVLWSEQYEACPELILRARQLGVRQNEIENALNEAAKTKKV